MIRKISVFIPIVFILLVFILLVFYMSPVAMAGHSTCIDGADDEYCEVTVDWQRIFSQMGSPSTSDLNDRGSAKYRNLFQGINTVFDSSTEQALTGKDMPAIKQNEDSIAKTYSDALGYPEYRYEIHGWGSNTIKIDDGETRKEIKQDVYQPSWSFREEKSINKFKVDSAITSVSVPDNTRIEIELYTDGDRNNRVATATYQPSDFSSSGRSVRTTDVNFEDGEGYNPVYYVSAVLERDSADIESPILGNNTLLQRELPAFRVSSRPYSDYPGETLSEFNGFMSKQYENVYGSNQDDSYVPRTGDFESVSTSKSDFGGSNVFYGAFSEITYVDNSLRVSDDYEDMNENNFDEYIVTKDGKIHVNYDSGVSDPPNDGNWIYSSGANDPNDGDERRKYSRDDIEYEIEVGYEELYGTDIVQNEIETVEEEESGHISVDYDENDISEDISSFYAKINVQVEYDKQYEEYKVVEEDCPANYSPQDEDYEDWVDEEDCNSPNDEYVENEYWTSNTDSSLSDCVQIAIGSQLIDNDPSCDEITLDALDFSLRSDYDVMDTSESYSFDKDKMDIYTAYMSEGLNTRVHKEEGTIWTDLESKQYSMRETIFVDDELDETLTIPTVRSVPEDTGEETYNVGGTDYDVTTVDYKAIDNQIDDQDVYLDLYTTGPLENSDEITVSVEDNQVYSGTVSHNRYDNLEFETLEKNIDISSEVQGESTIDIDFTKEGSDDDVRIDYVIRIESDKSINKLDSRWKYATFRDYRWEHIYKYTQECTSENCDKYSKHGRYIADDGERFLADDVADIPSTDEQGVYYFQTRTQTVKPYLVPTSRSIETQSERGYQEDMTVIPETSIEEAYTDDFDGTEDKYPPDFYLPQSNPGKAIDNLGNGIKPGSYEGKIYSDACPYEEESLDEGDSEDQYCGFTTAYAADIYNEINLNSRSSTDIDDIDFESYVDAEEGDAEEQESGDNEDVREGVQAFKSPYQYSDYSELSYSHLNSGTRLGEITPGPSSITADSKRYYPEYTKFNIITSGSSKWQVSGKSPWSEKSIDSQGKYMFDSVQFDIKRIDDLSEHLKNKDYTKQELENQYTDHKFVDDPEFDSHNGQLSQLRIRVTDEHNEPINFKSRRESQYDIQDEILVSNSRNIPSGLWIPRSYSPNKNGDIYVVVPGEDTVDSVSVRFYGDDSDNWWEKNDDARLLESSFNENIGLEDADNNNGDNSGSFPWLFIIFAIYSLAFIGSAMFRATGSEYTVIDVLKIPVELFNPSGSGVPGSDILLMFIKLFVLLTAIIAISPATSNPLIIFEPIAEIFGTIIESLLP